MPFGYERASPNAGGQHRQSAVELAVPGEHNLLSTCQRDLWSIAHPLTTTDSSGRCARGWVETVRRRCSGTGPVRGLSCNFVEQAVSTQLMTGFFGGAPSWSLVFPILTMASGISRRAATGRGCWPPFFNCLPLFGHVSSCWSGRGPGGSCITCHRQGQLFAESTGVLA